MTPTRIKRSRQHKQTVPAKYAGRGSKWGNPFRVVRHSDGKWAVKCDSSKECTDILTSICHAVYDTKQEAAADAVKCYIALNMPYTHEHGTLEEFFQSAAFVEHVKRELKGHNISCWCDLGDPCHVDWLLEIANT